MPLQASRIPSEIIAGMTLAALAIPEVMGYTKIAGMPVITGLYTMVLPMLLFALFGSSRHLVVSADSATAAMLAAGMVGIASTGTEQYVALAGALALMAAGFLLLARLIGLGFMANFLSRTVLIGFLTGVGIQVACGELSGMLGLEGGGHTTLDKLWHSLQQLGATNVHALAVSLGVLVIIVGSGRISKKIPGALIAVVGAIVLSRILDLQAHLPVLGEVPSGLPHLTLPRVDWSRELVIQLLPTAFAMFVVILAQSAATSRAYAARYNEQFSENTDLIGLGMANIGAAFTGTFVVNGSPTKTQMVDSAGGRTQLTHLITVLIVLLVLLFLTKPLAAMPEAVLSSVVFLVGIELIDIRGMHRIYVQRRSEFWIAVITAATVVLVGVEQGILLAMTISLLDHTRRGYRPKNTLLFKPDTRPWQSVPISQPVQALPGLMIYHFSHSMYYANAECLATEVNELTASPDQPLRWFCIELSAVDDVDFSAAETIRSLYEVLKKRGIRLVVAQILDDVKKQSRYDIISLLGRDAYYETLDELLEEYGENVLRDGRSDSPRP